MFIDLYLQFSTLINASTRILIVSHKKPDADALGSNIALSLYLKSIGKDVVSACVDKASKVFDFLPYISEVVTEFEVENFDLVILVDCGAREMAGFSLEGLRVVNIDHHASNDNFGELNIVDPFAASATVIIYRMMKFLGVEIDADMATCLLAGIYGDTGSFMHSNVSKEVWDIAAELTSKGANISVIVKNIFRSRSIGTLKLWGKVLEKAHITENGVVMSVMRDGDYSSLGASPEQLSGVVDYLNMVPNAKYALLLNEDRRGNVKGSLRTKNSDVDLSAIAAQYGGGGHPKASGFSLEGKLEVARNYRVVSDNSDGSYSMEF